VRRTGIRTLRFRPRMRDNAAVRPSDPCPCGTGETFGRCCAPVLDGTRPAATAEQLMRSRYSAYAVGDHHYLWRSWHPRTRRDVDPDPGLRWTGLEILATEAGGPGDDTGVVEFRAHYRDADGRAGTLHERSRFTVRAGRWFYLDGDYDDGAQRR
jgi:SEC-C motif-containing protein